MLPTYQSGDSVITFNWISSPKVGEVIVAKWQQKLIIKRVIDVKKDSVILRGDHHDSTSPEKLGKFKNNQIIGKVILAIQSSSNHQS